MEGSKEPGIEHKAPLEAQAAPPVKEQRRGWRFWGVMILLFCMSLSGAINIYALPTAFPAIASDLDTTQTSWIAQAQLICTIALQPWAGTLKGIFGARSAVLGFLLLYSVGTIVSATARNITVMLVGRCFSGCGNGGIYVLPLTLLSDFVPLSERGLWSGFILAAWALGGMIGPLIASALGSQWRWLLWICLILAGISAALAIAVLPNVRPNLSRRQQLKRLDYIGNVIFIGSTVALNLGLTWGGVTYGWANYRVLLPLLLGIAGYTAYCLYERRLEHPTMPMAIFQSRTAFLAIAIQSLIQGTCVYYLPLMLQTVQLKEGIAAGAALLPYTAPFEISGLIAGIYCTATRTFKLVNIIQWPPVILGLVFLGLLQPSTISAGWIGSELLLGLSVGIISDVYTLPILAALPASIADEALAFAAVGRYLALVLGTTIGITIVQNRLRDRLPPDFLALLPPGQDIAYTGVDKLHQAPAELVRLVQQAYSDSLRLLWFTLIAFAGVALIASLLIKEIPMATTLHESGADALEDEVKVDQGSAPRGEKQFATPGLG